MTIRNVNSLLSNAAKPVAGVQYPNAQSWYGGDLSVSVAGVFDGASVDLLYTIKMPPGGVIPADPSTWIKDTDWISLGTLNVQGRLDVGNINPCLLCMRVNAPGNNTRVSAIIG